MMTFRDSKIRITAKMTCSSKSNQATTSVSNDNDDVMQPVNMMPSLNPAQPNHNNSQLVRYSATLLL